MEALAQSLAILALRVNQPMRNMIFVEEIVDLISITRTILSDDAQAGKLAVAPQSLPAHDERAHDRLAHPRQFGQGLPNRRRGHFQNLGFIGLASGACQRGGPHEHGYVADEIARAGCPEDLFLSIAGLEDLEPAAQDYSQSEIALAGLEKDLAAAQNAPRAERFEHRKLPVIQFGKGDALGIAIELLVIIGFSHNWIG